MCAAGFDSWTENVPDLPNGIAVDGEVYRCNQEMVLSLYD